MHSRRLVASAVLGAALIAVGLGAHGLKAQDADPIAARDDAMDAIGDEMKGLAAIAKGERPFSGPEVKEAGETIAANLDEAQHLFPEGSTSPESRAKPEIWETPDDFREKLEEARSAAVSLAEVGANGQEDAYRQALMDLGGACKACHEQYRAPEDS